MIKAEGYNWFGYFIGSLYNEYTEPFENYRSIVNKLSKESVIAHIERLEPALTSGKAYDIFTGEKLSHPGMYIDGTFLFPTEFLDYYKKYDIGIPPEYEQYLIDEIGLKP